ncbi:HAD-IA family hydrolase [Streptococcus panodentis]|uniref:HAD family hydrolase n=1 Tax=Streptococcus panodentis TaxID=1581472 RepID=A0ABS5AWS0_9STRE|nr:MULTISPECIES: HAD-IA family hydrolase [Streptococcus]KXT77435.1 hydrolase, haloacid dehalogenase-like family [Streptococcus sp. DD11]MBP2621028.1 HAD family hydrolase [Streptococcus panodentis]
MTKAFIWDLDGTLLDSYEAILAGIEETYQHYGLDFDRESIRAYILQHSVQQLLEEAAAEKGLDAAEMNAFRGKSLREKNAQIHLMEGAEHILAWAREQGIAQFVYTHKGPNAYQVLEDLGILDYFTEIITTANGFARKPHPEGVVYLLDKYKLDRASTYYIGDRTLDVEVAANSGIQSINFCDCRPELNQKIDRLQDIQDIFLLAP